MIQLTNLIIKKKANIWIIGCEVMQRFFDLILSLFAITLLSPVAIPIILILRMTGEGEIFYTQERIGRYGHKFGVKKFATMLKNSPNIGTGTITVQNDPRVLPVGKVLRKTKINELPQLINIIKGEMSFIGPRPMTENNFNAYSSKVQEKIMLVRPGLSGAGSIVFRDEEKLLSNFRESTQFYNEVIAPYKGNLEMWYGINNSPKNYFLLLLITAYVVFFPSSKIFWTIFDTAPKPTGVLAKYL